MIVCLKQKLRVIEAIWYRCHQCRMQWFRIARLIWANSQWLTCYPGNHRAHEEQRSVLVLGTFECHQDFGQRKCLERVSRCHWHSAGLSTDMLMPLGEEKSDFDHKQCWWLGQSGQFAAPFDRKGTRASIRKKSTGKREKIQRREGLRYPPSQLKVVDQDILISASRQIP